MATSPPPTSILPVLSAADIQQAASLIQVVYTPGLSSEVQRRLQHELFEIQKKPEAWGLVIPFLEYRDPNVQFFGAHTAQVKIARDWDSFTQEHALALRDILLNLAATLIAARSNKVTLRKLFVAITSLALKIVPTHPTPWPEWIVSSVKGLSTGGAYTDYILDFLAIVAEEVSTSDLTPPRKAQMQQSLMDAVPLVIQATTSTLARPAANTNSSELVSAFKCLESWVPIFRADDVTPLIPTLINLLNSEVAFVGASDVLQELLTKSSLSDGSGTATITVPLLVFVNSGGTVIVKETLQNGSVDETSHSFCKLLVTLGEHSTNYIASHIANPLVQNFLRMLISYTALSGWYGVEEEESEMTLSFWYLLQEALWSVDFDDGGASGEGAESASASASVPGLGVATMNGEGGDLTSGAGFGQHGHGASEDPTKKEHWAVATALFESLVQTLKRKVTWPPKVQLQTWSKDQREKFQVYRRDVGDTLINAYYVLREKMLHVTVVETEMLLNQRRDGDGWESVESVLHCIMSVQEAVPVTPNPDLARLFSPNILGRLPTSGKDRVRRTALGLIGAYATWFMTHDDPSLLMGVLTYVVRALGEQSLCLPAANALRDLCDANRTALSSHIMAFGELHASLPSIPDSEKTKVIQSIASVIQALKPLDEIMPVEAIVSPVVAKLNEALNSANTLPDEARAIAILQLQTLSGCAKGLTRATDTVFGLDESPTSLEEHERVKEARADPRIVKLRDGIFQGIRHTMELWSNDALTGDALSDLFKSITSLPSDMTLISLPPGPLLELVCAAIQRHLNAVWLSLASMLVLQLDPPSPLSLKSVPSAESEAVVLSSLPLMLQACLPPMSQDGMMQENPDIVQPFFGCMEIVAKHFTGLFFRLPQGGLDALMQCATRALYLQERYSLVAACTFLSTLINRTIPTEEFSQRAKAALGHHLKEIMRAILSGFTGLAPASTTQNLIELLSTLVSRCPEQSKMWMPEIMFSNDFMPSKATSDAKEKFVKAVLSSRSIRKTKEAAQQFTLVAKGLEGSSFGYASVSM